MEETERRKVKRKKVKRKQQLILIGIITILSVLIITTIVRAYTNKKTKQVSEIITENISENAENIENDVLHVAIETNTIEENIVSNENTNVVEENKRNNTGGTSYRLEVNCEQNVVNVYKKDENGEYTNCVKAMLCSIGSDTPRSGTYSLKKYGGWEWKGLFGDVYGQYATQITGNILFHSVPYTEKYNNASLEYWEYDKLGTPASMGCVRLTVKNAKWIYDNCASGTKVMFYNDSNPGPLGKPSERKILSEEGYRNWDPTDPDSNNPWKNYKKEEQQTNKENIENNTQDNQNTNVPENNTPVNDEVTNNEITNNEEINDIVANDEITNNEEINDTVVNDEITNNEVK